MDDMTRCKGCGVLRVSMPRYEKFRWHDGYCGLCVDIAERVIDDEPAEDGSVEHMSDELLEKGLAICNAASPGLSVVCHFGNNDGKVSTKEEIAKHFLRWIEDETDDRCHAVVKKIGNVSLVYGVFGSGPESEANARFWVLARRGFPAALRLIKKLQADVDKTNATADRWQEEAKRYATNVDHWRHQAHKLQELVKEQDACLSTYENVDEDMNALHDQIADLNQERDKALNERDVAVDLLNQDDTVLRLYGLLSCTAKRYECEAQVQADNLGIVKARLDESEAGVDDLVSTADVLRDKVERLQIAVQKLADKSTMFADLAVDKGIFSSHDRAEEISEINNVLAVAGEAEDTNA
jgi:hypothetical protein